MFISPWLLFQKLATLINSTIFFFVCNLQYIIFSKFEAGKLVNKINNKIKKNINYFLSLLVQIVDKLLEKLFQYHEEKDHSIVFGFYLIKYPNINRGNFYFPAYIKINENVDKYIKYSVYSPFYA